MQNTAKQLNVRLSKEDFRRLEELVEVLGENFSQVLKRALNNLYDKYKSEVKT